ncbi:MAG: hypothetical protein JNJ56_12585 [Ignavibacteria bacterium]|nr:hypothetical protein [Ignavibacteria bacterium]
MKTEILNEKIIKIIPIESTVVLVEMITLSALATIYLRNNDLIKYKIIEKEIDEALKKCEEYTAAFDKSA